MTITARKTLNQPALIQPGIEVRAYFFGGKELEIAYRPGTPLVLPTESQSDGCGTL